MNPLGLALAAILLFQTGLLSQTGGENPKISVRSNLVSLPTRVQTKKGDTIYGLTPEQFIVEDNGIRQTIRVDEDPETSGLSLVVVVQCGRSAPDEFGKLRGLAALVNEIAGGGMHEVAVVSYGEKPYLLGDFSGNQDDVDFAISRLKPCGDYNAATIDAVSYAIELLKARPLRQRRAILLIGEARDHGSHAKLPEVAQELGVTDTVIYSVAFSPTKDDLLQGLRNGDRPPKTGITKKKATKSTQPPVPDPDYTDHPPILALPPEFTILINALRANAASELATLSGGEYINFTTQRGFEQGLQRISNQIHNYYMLSFQPPTEQTLAIHRLRVRVEGYPDAVIQTRKSYWSGELDEGK